MKALTLHQPWASLIAVGAKKIETRPWSTKYRGPLAIHAGKHRPRSWWSNIHHNDDYRYAPEVIRAATLLDDTMEVDGAYWTAEESSNGEDWYHRWRGPLGAVVATAQLVDVVRVTEGTDCAGRPWLDGGPFSVDLDQLPFGDFTPGRYAWLLENIEPLAVPVPAKGKQGLWTWAA